MKRDKVYELNQLTRERSIVRCGREGWKSFIVYYVNPNDMLYNVGYRVYMHDDFDTLCAQYHPDIGCMWLYMDYHIIARELTGFVAYPRYTVTGGPLLFPYPMCEKITMDIIRTANQRCTTPCKNGLVSHNDSCDQAVSCCYECVYIRVSEMFLTMANYECDKLIKAICQGVI